MNDMEHVTLLVTPTDVVLMASGTMQSGSSDTSLVRAEVDAGTRMMIETNSQALRRHVAIVNLL